MYFNFTFLDNTFLYLKITFNSSNTTSQIWNTFQDLQTEEIMLLTQTSYIESLIWSLEISIFSKIPSVCHVHEHLRIPHLTEGTVCCASYFLNISHIPCLHIFTLPLLFGWNLFSPTIPNPFVCLCDLKAYYLGEFSLEIKKTSLSLLKLQANWYILFIKQWMKV